MCADAISPVFLSPAAQNGKAPESAGEASTARFFRTGLYFFQKTLDLRAALWYNTKCCHLGVAQLVARYLGVVEAASSSLVTQTINSVENAQFLRNFYFAFVYSEQ